MACCIVLVVFLGSLLTVNINNSEREKKTIFKLNGTKSNSAQENNIFAKNVRIKYIVVLLFLFLWNYRTAADLYWYWLGSIMHIALFFFFNLKCV